MNVFVDLLPKLFLVPFIGHALLVFYESIKTENKEKSELYYLSNIDIFTRTNQTKLHELLDSDCFRHGDRIVFKVREIVRAYYMNKNLMRVIGKAILLFFIAGVLVYLGQDMLQPNITKHRPDIWLLVFAILLQILYIFLRYKTKTNLILKYTVDELKDVNSLFILLNRHSMLYKDRDLDV